MNAVPEVERAARAALLRAGEPGEPVLAAAVLAYGAAALLDRWWSGDELSVAGVDGRPHRVDPTGVVRRRLSAVDGRTELARGAELGARLVCPEDAEWPTGLDDLVRVDRAPHAGPPLAVWVRGRAPLDGACDGSVACVGSRAATEYGCAVASDLAADLAERGQTVVSGAAYGIDAAAHRGALAVGGRTVAVLASGVDVPYPRGHASLLERVLEHGLVVSECSLGAPPQRIRFLARNRLIAAMTAGTVVVEAAARSGALSTAKWARDLARPLMGVPGPVTSAMSAGVHTLIRDHGAVLVTGADDVVAEVGPLGEAPPPASSPEVRPWDGLDQTAAAVLEALPARGAIDTDGLLMRSGLAIGACLEALTVLMARELVEPDGPRWRLGPAIRRGRDP